MKTTRIPRGAFNAFCALIFSVSLCMFVGAPARADLLLYDGFATASDTAVADFVVDSAGGGSLTVGGGFFVIVR